MDSATGHTQSENGLLMRSSLQSSTTMRKLFGILKEKTLFFEKSEYLIQILIQIIALGLRFVAVVPVALVHAPLPKPLTTRHAGALLILRAPMGRCSTDKPANVSARVEATLMLLCECVSEIVLVLIPPGALKFDAPTINTLTVSRPPTTHVAAQPVLMSRSTHGAS